MDEYIKREDALDAILFSLVGTGHQGIAIRAVRDVPTSEVVPKSEIEQLKAENAKLLKALRIHGGCSACVHQRLKAGTKYTYECAVGGCNRNGKKDKWEWRGE